MKLNQNEFAGLYEKQRIKIEDKISRLLLKRKPESLYAPCEYIMQSGGKRLRPLLVLFSARAAGGSFNQAYNAAVAVELLHNFTLVHDDIMDNADKRRGRLTTHKKYDLSTAILTGDNLLAVAYLTLLKDCRENDKSVLAAFTQGVIEVCEGQSLDKDFEVRKDVSLDEYLEMINKKTAALLEVCCSVGAQIAGGDKKTVKALSLYGRSLGTAFQLQDDLLDITAKETEFGKIIGGDLVEGKKTFLFIKALEKAGGKDKKMLLEVIKNKGIEKKRVGEYKEIYSRLGVLQETQKEIEHYTQLALKSLKAVKDEKARGALEWLAESLIKRNK
ncbi:MAG: polyprenyl synthetase family protein [Bacteroidota bacterium]|nr:polyprenyl synthetase family protein [Ignavibacteria bacterium]MCU7499038.1 polyprenyl synthetase family protein [Ignavibacteria bacterium]MCU7512389.1 polyprenyl synthetase family protein [Ignavibacteria bacterium]MCU7521741.1 polyprenyl synthetase family protein [Ignavibacteria bacterium]MCU7524411.1 polyprenyl synthetase family protein [Ignavibacteria bacterium]